MNQPKFVPYRDMGDEERDELHDWFDAHGVAHRQIPVEPTMHLDDEGWWHVEIYSVNPDGRRYVGEGGVPARHWVTFEPKSPIPWRTVEVAGR